MIRERVTYNIEFSANTDMVPGQFYDHNDFLEALKEFTKSFPQGYQVRIKVNGIHIDRNHDTTSIE